MIIKTATGEALIIKTATVDGRQIEIYKGLTGPRPYWASVNHRALFQRRSLHVQTFANADAAWGAALKEAKIPPKISPARTVGYSNLGGGGPFAPMGAPRAADYFEGSGPSAPLGAPRRAQKRGVPRRAPRRGTS
jgi:hypothetical protein